MKWPRAQLVPNDMDLSLKLETDGLHPMLSLPSRAAAPSVAGGSTLPGSPERVVPGKTRTPMRDVQMQTSMSMMSFELPSPSAMPSRCGMRSRQLAKHRAM
jgi:hypothetical protein